MVCTVAKLVEFCGPHGAKWSDMKHCLVLGTGITVSKHYHAGVV